MRNVTLHHLPHNRETTPFTDAIPFHAALSARS